MASPARGTSVIRRADVDLGELPGAIVVYGADGLVHDATAAACEILGEQREHLIGSDAAAHLWQPAGRGGRLAADTFHPSVQAGRSRRPQRGSLVRIERPDSSLAWGQIDARPTLAADGCPRAGVAD